MVYQGVSQVLEYPLETDIECQNKDILLNAVAMGSTPISSQRMGAGSMFGVEQSFGEREYEDGRTLDEYIGWVEGCSPSQSEVSSWLSQLTRAPQYIPSFLVPSCLQAEATAPEIGLPPSPTKSQTSSTASLVPKTPHKSSAFSLSNGSCQS
jgi:hypothetical protein